MNRARLMFEMTLREVQDGLNETRTIVIPVGVLEQHGYHLPLSVDIHNAMEISRRASEITGCFVAPPVQYNFSGGSLPGTINISPQVFSLMLMDICESLVSQGFRNLVILLGHGGSESVAAAKEAAEQFQRLRCDVPEVTICLVPFWELSETCKKLFEERDYHAGLCETSLMLYWKPELVKMGQAQMDDPDVLERLREDPDAYIVRIRNLENRFVVPKTVQDRRIRVGVMGDYRGANAELGRKMAEECVQGLASLIRELEAARDNG